jgi:hypothetical protein
MDIAYFGGSHFMVKWPGQEDKPIRLASGGTIGAATVLRDDADLMQKLREACLQAAGIIPTDTIDVSQIEVQEG